MTEQTKESFLAHLAKCAETVKDWPDWKKNIWPDNTSESYVDYSNYYSEWPGD